MIGITSHLATRLLEGKLAFLRDCGFNVHLVSGPGEYLNDLTRQGFAVNVISFPREISPWRDLLCLVRLAKIIRRQRPDLVDFGTPKAGLLGMMAGRLCGIPHRIYTLRGLRLETTRGAKRMILRATEKIACGCATQVVCVSHSLREKAMQMSLGDPAKFIVLGHGSSNGVDADEFAATTATLAEAAALRLQLKIPEDAPVIGFVGRLTRDKGIAELVEAFDEVLQARPNARLLLLGNFEEADPVSASLRDRITSSPNIVTPPWTRRAAPYYHVMDILCLPTHREGFPNVVLEAAAAGKPVVTTNATGAVDSVQDRVTGLIVPAGDAPALGRALVQLVTNPALAKRMGEDGQRWIITHFLRETVMRRGFAYYCTLLRNQSRGRAEYELSTVTPAEGSRITAPAEESY